MATTNGTVVVHLQCYVLRNPVNLIRKYYLFLCRRRQLAELGSATGIYKTLVKYLVGVPEVSPMLLDAALEDCLLVVSNPISVSIVPSFFFSS